MQVMSDKILLLMFLCQRKDTRDICNLNKVSYYFLCKAVETGEVIRFENVTWFIFHL